MAAYGAVGLAEPEIAETPSSAGDGDLEVHRLRVHESVPLIERLAEHRVDDHYLWIAVEAGRLLVTDRTKAVAMRALVDGATPAEAGGAILTDFHLEPRQAQREVTTLLGQLMAAGLIVGSVGYTSVKKIRPHAFARFHLTQRCQLECVHCYTDSSPHLPSDGELSTERWLELVDDFADNGGEKALFTGGEALVHPGCLDILRRAHERGLEVTLFSNGILVPHHIDVLREVVDIVQISLDGPDEQTHDAIRGKKSFVKAMRAIRLLLDVGVETRISTTIMLDNWDAIRRALPGLIAEFEGTSASFRISYGAMAHGRGANLDQSLDTDAVRRFVDGLLSGVRTNDDRDVAPNAIQKISGCGYAEQLVVAPDGVVYPCHLMSGPLGHVDDLPLAEITQYLRRTAAAFDVNHREGCSTCDLRNLCGGSCRVEDEKHTGSRLITTCGPADKLRKKRFLARRYRPV